MRKADERRGAYLPPPPPPPLSPSLLFLSSCSLKPTDLVLRSPYECSLSLSLSLCILIVLLFLYVIFILIHYFSVYIRL